MVLVHGSDIKECVCVCEIRIIKGQMSGLLFVDQQSATSPVGCVAQHVYAGACLKSVRIVCSLVLLVISAAAMKRS